MIKSELQAKKLSALLAERDRLRAEIERLRKLCEDRPVYPPLSDKSDPYSAAFDAWLDRIDAAGRGERE